MPYKEASESIAYEAVPFPYRHTQSETIFVLCYKYVGGKLGQGFSQKGQPRLKISGFRLIFYCGLVHL